MNLGGTGCRDNKLGAVYYQMNLYAYMLETEMSVSESILHAVFFGQRCVESYLLPRANSSDAPPVPHTRFTESKSEQRLEPGGVLPMENQSRKGRQCKQSTIKGKTWAVDRIVDHNRDGRQKVGKFVFLVKWCDYPESANTWEPENGITPGCIQEYWENHDLEQHFKYISKRNCRKTR